MTGYKCFKCENTTFMTAYYKSKLVNCCKKCLEDNRAEGKEKGVSKISFSCAWKGDVDETDKEN